MERKIVTLNNLDRFYGKLQHDNANTVNVLNQSINNKQDTIDDLDAIRQGAEKGATALQSHQDISHLATKTEVNAKVDKVTGKQLSSEDFTTALKNKLNNLSNYDDTAVNNAINNLQTQINTLVSGDANTTIESFNEIIAFLDGVTDAQTLDGIIAGIEQQIAGKQAIISDLATIRSGASAGATAVQPSSLATVATSGSYNDLSNKPTIPDSLSDLSADSTHRTVTDTEKATWNAKSNFSGSYTDLTNKPTIPSAVTESTVSGWGFTKNTGTYIKPSTGIPKSDLTSAVQISLGKADTALQSYTEQYKGTVTGVKINGGDAVQPNTNGIVDLGTIVTDANVQAVDFGRVVDDVFLEYVTSEYVHTLVGDINAILENIIGGNVVTSNGYKEIIHGTSDTYITIQPNVLHIWDVVTSLNIELSDEVSGIANEYTFQFKSGSTPTVLSLPNNIKWNNDTAPTIEANKQYQISILKGLASILSTSI